MSYTAIISKIHTRPHPNADKLQLGTCLGNQVVVGLDTQDGEVGVFFPTDGQLSHEFCVENDLYNNSAREKLGLEKSDKPGFFDHNRRVRAQRFRGEKSDGIWLPPSSLLWTGADPSKLKEGDTFTEWGGYGICQKYFTPATLRAIGGNRLRRRDAKCFPKHDDTTQFRFVADQIPEDAVIYITEKLHGTSGRYGHVYDELPLTGWRKFVRRLAEWPVFRPPHGWTYLNGSRNVILEKADSRNSFYGTDDFRYDVVRDLVLHKGEVLYFEIVGWVNETAPVMPPHDVTKTGLKEILQQYGPQINYTYGCPPGVHRMYVYKIAHVNQDGVAWELPWTDVVRRCGELGLAHVPLLYGPISYESWKYWGGSTLQDVFKDELRVLVEALTEGPSTLDSTQIREGVVIRVESSRGISHAKNKQFAFGVLEGFWKEQDDATDIEEIA